MNYTDLINKIAADIVPGLPKGVTAEKLKELFNELAQFANETRGDYQGPAAPADNPGTPTDPVYYIATTTGTYTNFGGLAVTASDGLNILSFVPGTGWSKAVVPIDLDQYAEKDSLIQVFDFTDQVKINPKNLFNKLKTRAGYHSTSGSFLSSLNTLCTDFIPVISGQVYTMSPNPTLGVANRFVFFDTNKVFFSSVNSVAGSSHTITSPVTGFVVINIGSSTGIGSGDLTDNALVNNFQFEKGSVVTAYSPYLFSIDGTKVENISSFLNIPQTFDSTGSGSVYRSDTGAITNISGVGYPNASRSTAIFAVTPGDKYLVSCQVGGSVGMAGYNNLGVYNSRILDSSGLSEFGSSEVNNYSDLEIIIPEDVFFVGLSTRDSVNHPIVFSKIIEGPLPSLFEYLFPLVLNPIQQSKIKVQGISSTNFIVHSITESGEYLQHVFEKIVKTTPQLENGWLCSNINHGSNLILQGNFNWIHQINKANETGVFVGIGHGCEVFIETRWFLNGSEFDPASIVGQTIEGSLFSFHWVSEIYVPDAVSTSNGAEVVAKVPNEKSTRHHLYGEIRPYNETYLRNKLIFLRDDVSFVACYPVMLAGYSPYFKYMQIENIENSINIATPSSQTSVSPSTAVINGQTYNTSFGKRAELAFAATMWSDDYPYKVTQVMKPLLNAEIAKFSIQSASGPSGVSSRNKLYLQPVITSVIASARTLSADVFNEDDFIEVEGYRKITL